MNHLTVSHGLSLHTFISHSVICCNWQFQLGGPLSDTFEWALTTDIYQPISDLLYMTVSNGGRTLAKEGSSAKSELVSGLTLASQRSFLRKTNELWMNISNIF